MTSYTGGRSCPPYSLGHDVPKKPCSYSAWCQAPWAAQYSSPDVGNLPFCSVSQPRNRSRKAASSGESRKSNGQLLQLDGPRLRGGQHAPQIDVGEAFPGVADTAVNLNRGLTDGQCRTRTVDLGNPRRFDGLGGGKFVDRPRGMAQDTDRPLDQRQAFGEQVADSLIRADRRTVLLANLGVLTGQCVGPAGGTHQVGARDGQREYAPAAGI